MKIKKFNEKYEKKVKKIDKKNRKFFDLSWVLKVSFFAFLISLSFSIITEVALPNINVFMGVLVLFSIIVIGVLFDMVGVSVTAASLKPFNSMASKKVKGSKTAIWLIQNAEKVSAFCNDVIGDVCGIISGSVGILISSALAVELKTNISITTLILTAVIASLTIGGKAVGKSYAINKSDVIVFRFAKIIKVFRKEDK